MIWFYYLINHRSADVLVAEEMVGDVCVCGVYVYINFFSSKYG